MAALFAIGCAPRGPKLPQVEGGATGGALVAELLAGQPCPETLASDLDMTLKLPDKRPVRMTGALRVAWPDRLRLQARVGAFWPVASIAVRADSAFVSLPRLKGYWAGDQVRSIGTNPAALASTLFWLLCPGPLAGALVDPTLESTSDGWVLGGRLGKSDPPLYCELHLPEEVALVREILFREADGEILLRAWRLGQKSLDGVDLPEIVRLQVGLPVVRFETRLVAPRVDSGAGAETFRIAQPNGFRTIPEDELLEMFRSSGQGE